MSKKKHGHCSPISPTYQTFISIQCRIRRPVYIRRGITICDKWKNFSGFLEDMGPRPEKAYLIRKDMRGGFNKKNCYWGLERPNRHAVFSNEEESLIEGAIERSGLTRSRIIKMYRSGIDLSKVGPTFNPYNPDKIILGKFRFDDRFKTVYDLCEELGISRQGLHNQLNAGKKVDFVEPIK